MKTTITNPGRAGNPSAFAARQRLPAGRSSTSHHRRARSGASYLLALLLFIAAAVQVRGQVYPPPTVLPVFTNGDFETGDFTGWTLSGDPSTYNLIHLDNGSSGITPQSGTDDAVLQRNPTRGPTTTGYLSQSLPTIPGYDYNLSISWWVYNPSGDTNTFQASLSGTAIVTQTNQVANGWINLQGNIEFGVAVPGSTVLQFAFTGRGHAIALDNIALQWTDVPVQGWFTYTTNNDGTLNITGCNGCGGTLIIPGWINLTPVTSIGANAFQNYASLTSVTIGTNVTSIGDHAFQNCSGLTGCYCRGNAPIAGGMNIFAGDNNAKVYYMPGTTGWGATFGGGQTALWQVPNWNYVDNNGIITITGYTGPGGVVYIPVVINGLPVTSIGMNAFNGSSMASVTIPGSITNIGPGAFFNCTSLTSVTLGSGVTTIGYNAFMYCAHLTSITIPNSVTSIGGNAFTLCASLASVTLGTGITSIVDDTFYGCSNLTSVTIPATVTSIGNGAFHGCSKLASITIPNSVSIIYSQAFENCSNLTSVTIPGGVTYLGDQVFENCTRLTAITVDPANSFYSSMNGVLFNYSHTTLIEYPEGKSVSYTVPTGVTTIGANAFYGCAGLTGVIIPASVTSIGDYAFYGCTSLTGVCCMGNAPNLTGTNVFSGDNNATVYYMPGTTGWGGTFGGRPTVGPEGVAYADSTDFTLNTGGTVAGMAGVAYSDSTDFTLNTGGALSGLAGVAYADSTDFSLNTGGAQSGLSGVAYSDSTDFTLNTGGALAGIGGVAYADSVDFTLNTGRALSGLAGVAYADSTDFTLNTLNSVVSGLPQLTSISIAGTTLTIQAVNGTVSGQYVLLGSTNAALPLSQWTPLLTNNFSSGGILNLSTNIINPAVPQQFYMLEQ